MTDRTPAVHTALSGAAAAFVTVMLLHVRGGISEKEETRVFVLACILVPITGIVVAAALDAIQRRFVKESALFWPLLALGNAILWVFLVDRIRVALPPPKTGAQVDLVPVFRKVLLMWGASNVALVSFAALTHRLRFVRPLGERLTPWVDRALPFIVFYALLPFTMHTPPVPWRIIGVLALAGIATALHRELFAFPRRRSARLAFDVLVLIGLYLLVIDPSPDASEARILHHNFYLGPAAAVRAGKTLLVDVNCQYGVGVIYFIASLLRFKLMQPSMYGFSYIVCLFGFFQYATWYATLRMTTRSVALSALVFGVAFMVTLFEQAGRLSEYPSTGGIRFLPGYLFVLCIALKARFPRQVPRIVILESLVVGGASIWSFEAFVYVLVAYLGSVVYDLAHVKRSALLVALRERLTPTLLALVGWQVWLAAFTHYRSGAWPHWWYYLEFIRLYSVKQFGTLPVEPWTPWLVIGGAYAVGVTALGYRRLAEETMKYRADLAVVFTMCALGIGQYTYFLGRSHVNNLFHICLPAFFVAAFIFIRAARDVTGVRRSFRRALVFVGYAALALCFFSTTYETVGKWEHTELAALIKGRRWTTPEPAARVKDSVDLIHRYLGGSKLVAFFSSPDTDVDVYLRSHKASLYPVGYQAEDELLDSAKARISAFDDHLRPGDIVVIDTGTRPQPEAPQRWLLATDVNAIDRKLWEHVEARFNFEVVDERKHTGLFALRLVPR